MAINSEVRKIKVRRLDDNKVRKIEVKKLPGYEELKKHLNLRKVSIKYTFCDELTDRYISITSTIKQLINSGLADKYLKNMLFSMVEDINLHSFITFYRNVKHVDIDNEVLDKYNVIARNTLVIIDFLSRKHGVNIVDRELFDRFQITFNSRAIMRKNHKKLDLEPFDHQENIVIRDSIILEKDKNIKNDKFFEGSDVLVNIGNGTYKSIPYEYFKKVNKINFIEFTYLIKEYDPYTSEDIEYENKEDGCVIHPEAIKTITGVNNIISELFSHDMKSYFYNSEIVPTFGMNFELVIVDLKVTYKNGKIENYDDLISFTRTKLPGIFE